MTRQELMDRIEKINTLRFYLSMKDYWDREDYQRDNDFLSELRMLKQLLADMQ